ncbi:MAG: DUF937 domain-containing protein [Bacteroidota bacterium]
MLDSLLDGMKGQVASALAEKTGINMGQAEQAVPLAGESIKEGIMGAVTKGNTDDVMIMFSSLIGGGGGGGAMGALAGLAGGGGGGVGGMMKNMVFSGIAQNFVGKLTSKLGIPAGIANSVSSMALPMIMGKIGGAAQSATPGDGIDAAGLMKVLGGGGGALGALGGLMGGGGADSAVDAAKDALKDKLGGLGGLLG